jgi:hypothetical protein
MTTAVALDHLAARIGLLDGRVRRAVDRRRQSDPDPDDRFRGLYIADAEVDRLLEGPRRPIGGEAGFDEEVSRLEAQIAEIPGGDGLRLPRLQRSFGLDAIDLEILLVALAPDVDQRFERFYGYLHDDVSRRRASVGLALELAAGPNALRHDRHRLLPHGPLVHGGLLLVEDVDRPFLTRSLRVPDRVTGHLFGDDDPDRRVWALLGHAPIGDAGDADLLAHALNTGTGLVYLRDRPGSGPASLAAQAAAAIGRASVVLDLERLAPGDDVTEVARLAAREALLTDAVLVAGPVGVLADRGADAVRAFAEAACTVVLVGAPTWDPRWARRGPLALDAPVLSRTERSRAWSTALGEAHHDGLAESTVHFRLSPDQIHRAAQVAMARTRARGDAVAPSDVQSGARAQNAAGLERLARRIEPAHGWESLVVPTEVRVQLEELAGRVRNRDLVYDEWGMGSPTRGRGITGLFAGESGTGKTLSAEVVGYELGLDLYVIDLSTVVDKYIGETEKNLDRIFAEADRINGLLLFDEADALFGKRSEVSDARDRYANVEVAYLLQRMELFDGLAILTSNLRSNLDEAFTRRLDAVVDFPLPEEDDRLELWQLHLRSGVPRGDDIDFAFLARAFKLSGGNIRNIALTAALLAAGGDGRVEMRHLIHATEREYRKLGRLCVPDEFGAYWEMLTISTSSSSASF